MEAYYGEVRCLEDKFHGLELNHITRRYNEAADELAKITSRQTTVPPDVFAKDLHQPSINIEADGGVDKTLLQRHPGVLASSYPIKGQARALKKQKQEKAEEQRTTNNEKPISFCTLIFPLRPGLGFLSHSL
jgi:ribosomal protein S2